MVLRAGEKKKKSSSSPLYASIEEYRRFVELRERTREAYVSYVVLLARHHGSDPAGLSDEQVRDYFLFLRKTRNYSPSAISLRLAALRSFYQDHLQVGAQWKLWRELKVRRGKPLPVVLSREEVALPFPAYSATASARCCG